jgi:hypothetical protein
VSLLLLFNNGSSELGSSALNVDAVSVVQRVQQNTSTTIDLQMTRDGVATDPEPATARVTIVRDDGTVLIDNAEATRTGTGHFAYILAAAQTAQLDWLTATWDITVDGQPQYASTRIEIVGGFLIGLGDLRADRDLTNTATYPTSKLADARTYAEQELEQACGVAFVPRYGRRTLTGSRDNLLPLTRDVRTIRSSTVNGALADVSTLAAGDGFVYNPSGWGSGYQNVTIRYEHGMDYPPAAVSQAALILAKDYLVRGPLDDRAIQRATEDGPVFIATPGWNGNRFGIPQVDAVVDSYRVPSIA